MSTDAEPEQTAVAPEPARPDAVKFPHSFGAAGVPDEARTGIVATAEKLLGVDKSNGELARCRPQGGYVFATRERGQSLKFPESHPMKGLARYSWTKRDGGVEVGTLVPAAMTDHVTS